MLKYNPGRLILAAGATASWGWFDTTRNISFPGVSTLATSDNDVQTIAGQLHAGYVLGADEGFYLKPLVDASVTHVGQDGFTENATGGLGLTVAGADDTVITVSPGAELGASFRLSDWAHVRPYVRGAATWRDKDKLTTDASFAGATQIFSTVTSLDNLIADVSAGLDFEAGEHAALRMQYDGRFGDTSQENALSVKAFWRF